MKLSQKLLLFVLAAAVVPLAFTGFWLLRQAETELTARLEREERALASAAAEATGTQLAASLESLAQSATLIDWPRVSAEEAAGGLQLLASQSPVVIAATLVDPARPAVAPSLLGLEGRPAFATDRPGLVALLPLSTLGAYGEAGQMALGPAQASKEGAWMPAAIQVGPRGPQAPMVVLALTLTVLDAWLKEHAPPSTTLEIVDADGRVVSSSVPVREVTTLAAPRLAVVRSGHALAATGAEQLAVTKVPGRLGLTAVVSIPLDVARQPLSSLRRSVVGGMGGAVLLLVIVSVAFSRRLAARLEKVGSVADAYAKGELSRRVELDGADELATLAGTFNAMGGELEAARARLLRWNDELAKKVDEATAELRAAQAQLLEAQKLAAIGQLGAGVAHEINNPLVGILGNAQLLLMDHGQGDPDFDSLKQIEDSAKRCRDITQQLLRFSQKRGEVAVGPMDLVALVKRTMALEQARAADVAIELQLPAGPVQIDGDPEQLEQVLSQLCTNARTAMAASATKRISVSVQPTPEGATLVVADTGKGIAPEHLERVFEPFFTTKDVWTNIGLGLAVAYRVVQEHGGRIELTSEPGKGARFTISLRAAGTAEKPKEKTALDVGGKGRGITG